MNVSVSCSAENPLDVQLTALSRWFKVKTSCSCAEISVIYTVYICLYTVKAVSFRLHCPFKVSCSSGWCYFDGAVHNRGGFMGPV